MLLLALDDCLGAIEHEEDRNSFGDTHFGDLMRCAIMEYCDRDGIADLMERVNFKCEVLGAIQASIETLGANVIDLTASQAKYVINFTRQSNQ